MIDADPLFVDPSSGDYHILPVSPCINAGNPDFVPAPGETDIDGEPRVMRGRVDMGADEVPYLRTIVPSTRLGHIEWTPPGIVTEDFKLVASNGEMGDEFGYSVAVSGSLAVIGARYNDSTAYIAGAAYIFRFDGSTWTEEAQLLASDGYEHDELGYSVASSGDVVVVGAVMNDELGYNVGAAYVYRYDGTSWVEEAKLMASDGDVGDYFGYSVSISNDVALIGAPFDEHDAGDAGSAYLFRYNGTSWVEEAKLTASDASTMDGFGISVSISGNSAVIGADYDNEMGDRSGSAYVFRYNGISWGEEAKLYASDGAANDNFGRSVSISGKVVLIGSYFDDDSGDQSGSAYIFRYGGSSWGEETKLLASDGHTNQRFGRSVSISGDRAVVGAFMDDDNGNRSGSAYQFEYNGGTWNQKAKLLASDGAADDYFGMAVGISGDIAVVGAYQDDDQGINSGSTYVFDL
jgi:hypothetical protein